MNEIVVTQAIVRNLAASLSKIDTTNMKHTDRLALIADAFGWKPDAFMGALKSPGRSNKVETKTLIAAERPFYAAPITPNLEKLGLRQIDLWKKIVSQVSGVCLIVGPTGSGKTELARATFRHLGAIGRKINVDGGGLIPSGKTVSPTVFICDETQDMQSAKRVFDLAERGHLVLATMHAHSAASTLTRLRDLGVAEERYGLVRGVASTRLVRMACPDCRHQRTQICATCRGEGYFGRTMVSAVVDTNGVDPRKLTTQADEENMAKNMAFLVERGTLDFNEIARTHGPRFVKLVTSAMVGSD